MGYEITWAHPDGVIKRHFGLVTGSELLAAAAEIEGDARFDALRYVINDFRECTGQEVSLVEIDEMAAIDSAATVTNKNIRIAVVAINPDVLASANYYANNPESFIYTKVFCSMAEARAWLGLSRT